MWFEAWWYSSRCLLDSFLFFRWRSSRCWKISIWVDSLWKIGTKLQGSPAWSLSINYMHIWLVEFRLICAKPLFLPTFQKIFFETFLDTLESTRCSKLFIQGIHQVLQIIYTRNPLGAHNLLLNPSNFIKKLEWWDLPNSSRIQSLIVVHNWGHN
jgi:hypothetical protein